MLDHLDPLRLSTHVASNGAIKYVLRCILPFHVELTTYGEQAGSMTLSAVQFEAHHRMLLVMPENAIGRVFVEEGPDKQDRIVLILVGEELRDEVVA